MKTLIKKLGRSPVVSVVRLSGVISAGGRGGATLSDEAVAPLVERAFRKGRPRAVALVINSPGGSPVQSSLIGARIRRLSEETGVPVLAFVEDIAASGGYWLATAADEIWVDDSSMVGSIGVISAGFGLQDLIARYGVERRVHTAGRSKSQLDPFRPETPEDTARLEGWLGQIHQAFIRQVTTRRGARLKEGETLFEGDVWIGAAAVEAGLVDGVGHLVPVMTARFGPQTKFRVYGPKRRLWQRLGASVAAEALTVAEDRLAFARFGL
ncbi:MAG: S49 family peptidase [Qingshengfaniella sp.]